VIHSQSPNDAKRESYFGRMLCSLRYRNFVLVWLGSLTEHFGEFMEIAAVLWLVHEMTHSPLILTIVGSCRFFLMIPFSVIGGIVADRVDRRRMLINALLGSSLLSTCLALLVITGMIKIWHIVVISLIGGVVMSFNHPARLSILPNLVDRKHLLNAVSLDTLSVQGSRVGGMLIAGYLIALFGVWPIFIIRAVGCVLAVAWLLFARVPPTQSTTSGLAPWQNLAEGFRYMRENRTVLGLTALYLLPWLVMNTFTNFLPVFANDILHIGPVGYGYLQGAPGLGAIASLLGLTLLTYYEHKYLLIICSGAAMGIGLISLAASPWLVLSLLSLVVIGGMLNALIAVNTALIQESVPDHVRGRVIGWREVAFGLGPTGSILFGAIARYTSVPFSLGMMGSICIAISISLILMKTGKGNSL
jgi:MFS family permease